MDRLSQDEATISIHIAKTLQEEETKHNAWERSHNHSRPSFTVCTKLQSPSTLYSSSSCDATGWNAFQLVTKHVWHVSSTQQKAVCQQQTIAGKNPA
jgi:hypothetical protein